MYRYPATRDKESPPAAPAPDLGRLAVSGHYIALRVGFAYPLEEDNALPASWVEHYTRAGLLMADPVMHWVHGSTGSIRWSALADRDSRGVLAQAAEYGLRFGLAVSILDPGPKGHRSWGSFARPDREFTDEEIALLEAYLRQRHESLAPPTNITRAELEALRLVKDGQRLKQIAWQLGVTEGAVKQRLKSARLKLEAKTGAEAISRATSFGLI